VRRVPVVPAVVVVLVVVVLAGLVGPGAISPVGAQLPEYRAPVPGPVVSPFSLPPQPWMAGNRGVDYDPPPGTPVTAAADGEVVFAGSVGGARHVTVRHPDGLRTSYSFLAEVSVTAGQLVQGGEVVGVTGGPVHFGVRDLDGTYLDPAKLLDGTLTATPILVPGTGEGADPLVERRSLLATLGGTGLAAASWAADGLRAGIEGAIQAPIGVVAVAAELGRVLDGLRDCTPASVAVPRPAGRRIAVVVSGFGTGSGGNSAWELPTDVLGYAPADVVRFSYAGGRAPDGAAPPDPSSAGLAGIEQREFTGGDSQQDLRVSADRLAALLAEVSAREPGVPIDVIAHSQGGVVSRLALDRSAREGRVPPAVETLVTLGSPHGGTPPADIVEGLGDSRPGRALLAVGMEVDSFEGLDPGAAAVDQLGESADVLRSVADRPLPAGVAFTSIAARWDLTVPAGRTADAAARHVVVDPTGPLGAFDAHGSLTTSPEAVREVGLAIAGRGPTCEALLDALVDRMASQGIVLSERAVAAALDSVAVADRGLAGAGLGP
jgi:hypothetical protein